MAKSVLHIIEDSMSTFSKGQKRIGRYILEHYDQAAFMTASKLGKLTEVSESTVVRSPPNWVTTATPPCRKRCKEMARSRLTSTQRIQAAGEHLWAGRAERCFCRRILKICGRWLSMRIAAHSIPL